MSIRVAINGFGRIGRNVLRAAKQSGAGDIDFVAVNDLTDTATLAHLLRYDSVHGRYPGMVEARGEKLVVDGDEIRVLSERDPAALGWGDLGVDIVIESTGIFTERDKAAKHLEAGAKKVIISAPPKGEKPVRTIVYGVNHDEYDGDDVLSNASCTTNSVAPVAKVLDEEFGIESGLLTTVHAYTGTQNLVDGPSGKTRRGRAAAENIIPTSTGAAQATTEVLPQLEGKLDGMAMRVPVPNGSITDLVVDLEADVGAEEVNAAFKEAATGELEGVLGYTDDEITSRDILGLPFSSYVDCDSTLSVEGGQVKVLTWYDNEYGFANRMLDLAQYVVAQEQEERPEAAA
jgi:glyceraldehyde 3-phosphate dehydrogenase